MRRRWHLGDLIGYFSSWSAVARFRAAEARDPLPEVADALAEVWGDPGREREITWPLHLRVGRVGGENEVSS